MVEKIAYLTEILIEIFTWNSMDGRKNLHAIFDRKFLQIPIEIFYCNFNEIFCTKSWSKKIAWYI